MSRSTSPGPEVQGQVQKSKSNKFSSAGRDEVQKSKSPEVQIPGLQRSRSPSPIKIPSAGRGEVQIPEVQKSKFPGPKVQKVWTEPRLQVGGVNSTSRCRRSLRILRISLKDLPMKIFPVRSCRSLRQCRQCRQVWVQQGGGSTQLSRPICSRRRLRRRRSHWFAWVV